MENVVTLTHRSTHCYLVELGAGMLMVDAGWPDSLRAIEHQLRTYRVAPSAIQFVLITHTHPDHAGLAQTIKQEWGARLLIHAVQVPFLPDLAHYFKTRGGHDPIVVGRSDVVLAAANRSVLAKLGIRGEVLPTPGHSDDSVSLVLDSGLCFTGDLPPPQFARDEAAAALTRASWQALLDHGARAFYPAHAPPFSASAVRQALAGEA